MAIPNRNSLHSLALTKTVTKDTTSDVPSLPHSENGSNRSSAVNETWPVHPIQCMRGPFQESIIEAMDPDARIRQTLDAATRRLQLLELDDPKDEHYSTRWRHKPGAKFHPLWKLIAQISFGIHLLHQQIAKSEEEVIRILQTHVDEIDGFLEDAGADFDLAMRDVDERLRLLLLPLEHGRTFNKMLRDRDFRISIIEGNDIIERICSRTSKAMGKSLDDVEKGLEATKELAKFLDRLGKDWNDRDEEMQNVYTAMRGNAEGWYVAFGDIKKKGEKLKRMIRRLERIVAEVERQAGIASRRKIRQQQTLSGSTNEQTPNEKTPYETPAEVSKVASPTHSRSPSSFRASMNKPLPPDPHRRSSKQHTDHKRQTSTAKSETTHLRDESRGERHSAAQTHSAKPSAQQIETPKDVQRAERLTEVPRHFQDGGLIIEMPTDLDFIPTMNDQSEMIDPTQIPLPLSPRGSPNDSPTQARSQVGADASQSPEKLIQQAVPKALVPELHIPSAPRPKSHIADKHQSASIVEAYNQSRSPSTASSRRVAETQAAPKITKDVVTKPTIDVTSDDLSQKIPVDPPSPATNKNLDTSPATNGPPRISLRLGTIDATKSSPLSPDFATFKSVEQPISAEPKIADQQIPYSGPKHEQNHFPAAQEVSELDNRQINVPQMHKVPRKAIARKPVAQREMSSETTSLPVAEAGVRDASEIPITSEPSREHQNSISSAGSVAQESTAVHRPHSRASDVPSLPNRTISMHAFGPATSGIADSDLPEIVVEPNSPQANSASSGPLASPPTPTTPPGIPDRSPARAPPRSGGRSPVSYKLIPTVHTPPPNEHEQQPKTALPQLPKQEPNKRFRKPSMNAFRGMIFKKNSSRQVSNTSLGGNVALA